VNKLQDVVFVSIANVKRLGEPVAEIMGRPGLERLAVVHHSFDGIGFLGAGKFFAFGFPAFFPAHHRTPLVIELRQIPVRLHNVGIMLAKQRF
jgi:hypothetical protein